MRNGGGRITRVKTYYCGYCVNYLHRMVKNVPPGTRAFPATAVLFQHEDDYYLFDTGFAPRILRCGWRSKIYQMLNPVVCSVGDSLKEQLRADGINPGQIKGIILSHLHPDHIGGLLDFPHSRIIISQKTHRTLQKANLSDLIFEDLLPGDLLTRMQVVDLRIIYDLFGDGSVLLKDISGHTHGQTGMYLREHNRFYAADSSWGSDLWELPLRFIARLLQKDYRAYQSNLKRVKHMQAMGIEIVLSHEVRHE